MNKKIDVEIFQKEINSISVIYYYKIVEHIHIILFTTILLKSFI